jgi:hypothetical protein
LRNSATKSGEEMPSSATPKLFKLVCLLIAAWNVAPASQYFVDRTHGNDQANGRTAQTAWQHLSAVNRYAKDHRFAPGDSVLLKSGERWREQLELSGLHGRRGAPIRFGSYGTGDYPTIDAADEVTGWTRVSPAVYQATVADDVYKVFVDGNDRPVRALVPMVNFTGEWQSGKQYAMWDSVQNQGKGFIAQQAPADGRRLNGADWFRVGQMDATLQGDGTTNVTQTAGSWWYDAKGKRILVHLADGSSPSSHSIQVTTRRYGVRLQASSNVVIEGIRIIHSAKAGIAATVADTVSADTDGDNQFNTIQNCIFWNVADTTSDFSQTLNVGGEGGIYVAAGIGPGRQPLDGWTIKDNAIGMIDSRRNLIYERDGILANGTTNLTLQNNYVSTINALGISVTTDRGPACFNPSITGNYLTNNDGNLRISGCTQPLIAGNTIENSYGYGIQIGGNSPSAKITRNVIRNIERLGNENAYNGIDCNGGAPGGLMSQNAISAVWGAEATLEVGCGHWTVENNLFDSSGNMKGGGLTLYIRREAIPGLELRNNTYRLNTSTTRQFNFGAGQPGGQTFHDVSWWQQNVETTARLSGSENTGRLAAAVTAQAAAVTGTFVKSPAALNYQRVAPAIPWEP